MQTKILKRKPPVREVVLPPDWGKVNLPLAGKLIDEGEAAEQLERSLLRLKRALNFEGTPYDIIDRAAKEIYVLRDERDSLKSTLQFYRGK